MTEFEQFWARYPKKVGRLYAEKCYRTARKRASHDDIMAGLERYVASKPAWQAWAHASSWLNAGRWMDEYDPVTPEQRPIGNSYAIWRDAGGCKHEPRCGNYATCVVVSMRATKAS